jgi:hypothetical protein
LLKLARACGADIVFLAFLGEECPSRVLQFVQKNSSGELVIHMLRGPELELG